MASIFIIGLFKTTMSLFAKSGYTVRLTRRLKEEKRLNIAKRIASRKPAPKKLPKNDYLSDTYIPPKPDINGPTRKVNKLKPSPTENTVNTSTSNIETQIEITSTT